MCRAVWVVFPYNFNMFMFIIITMLINIIMSINMDIYTLGAGVSAFDSGTGGPDSGQGKRVGIGFLSFICTLSDNNVCLVS